MRSILLGLTRQYLNAFRTVAAPIWGAVILLLVGGPMLAQMLMRAAAGGEVDLEDSRLLDQMGAGVQVMATVFFGFAALAGMFQKPRCVFTLPVSARVLATWQFVVAAFTVVFCDAALLVVYRLLFDVRETFLSAIGVVPVMVTAIFLMILIVWRFVPATCGGVQGASDLIGASLRRQLMFALSRLVTWLPLVGLLVAFVIWKQAPTNSVPGRPAWSGLAATDVGVLLVISGIAWALTIREIDRQRHGDVDYRSFLERGGDSTLTRFAYRGVPAPGEWKLEAAHAWFYWQSGRTLLLFGAVFVVVLLLVVFAAMAADRRDGMLEGMLTMLIVMPVLGALLMASTVGMNTMHPSDRKEMRKHLAVVPVSDRNLAATMMSALVRSLCGIWGLVAVTCVLGSGWYVWLRGAESVVQEFLHIKAFQKIGYWMIPLVLLSSVQAMWTTGGLTATLAWTGREKFLTSVILGLISAFFVSFFSLTLLVPEELREDVGLALLGLVALVTVGLVVWSYLRASRRELLVPRVALVALIFWAVEAGFALLILPAPVELRVVITGLLGLSVLPITASPLAVAWNRHR